MNFAVRNFIWNTTYTSHIFLFIVSLVCLSAQAEDITIPEKKISPPAFASNKLYNEIKATKPYDVLAVRQREVPVSQLDAVKTVRNAHNEKAARALIEKFNVEVVEQKIDDIGTFVIDPGKKNPVFRDSIFVYVHGGAFLFGEGMSGLAEAVLIAHRLGIKVISIDYSVSPNAPFPRARDEVLRVYNSIRSENAKAPVFMGASSAGCNIVMASLAHLKASGSNMPAAVYLGSPWTDLSDEPDTIHTHEGIDRYVVTFWGGLDKAAQLYAGGRQLTDPAVSPVRHNVEGFPPTFLVSGTRDLFLSHTAITHRKLRQAGVVADLSVYEGLSHVEYIRLSETEESQQIYAELGSFLKQHKP